LWIEYKFRTAEEAERYGMLVGIHTHNDFGLALANTFGKLTTEKILDLVSERRGRAIDPKNIQSLWKNFMSMRIRRKEL